MDMKTFSVKWCAFVCARSITENLASKLFSHILASKFEELAT